MRDEDREFQKAVMEGLVPKVEGSSICISICPQDEESKIDAKFCTELGVMIMLDKPIIAVVAPGAEVPGKLELVADKIVTTDAGRELLMEAIADMKDSLA